MRDAAGQLADRFHLLDLAELGFGRLALVGLGLQRLVGLPQLLGALARPPLRARSPLGLAFRPLARDGILAKRLDSDQPRKIAPSPTITPSQLR